MIHDVDIGIAAHGAPHLREDAIRSLIQAAKLEAYQEAAKVAETYVDPIDIAHHIRKLGAS